MVENIIDFEIPKISPSIIMVAGVGGGGSNAVNHMFELGIADVSFMVCNTDRQALYRSPVPIKVRLGENLTQGLGAGNNPERGREAALESINEITDILKREQTKMVFITAGMGGGTGTGAAPVIAKVAKELGILTVGIVTLPFKTEGKKRMDHAFQGIEELRMYVDSLLLINNENIQEIYGKLTLTDAFGKADDILATAAKSIAEIITRENIVNVDFADVHAVMSDSGVALMGSGIAAGEDRALEVAKAALSSPLLNHNDIVGAKNILINITSGEEEITLEETYLITQYIQERAGNNADIIWGAGTDLSLGKNIEVTIIATGFDINALPQIFSIGNVSSHVYKMKEAAQEELSDAMPHADGNEIIDDVVKDADQDEYGSFIRRAPATTTPRAKWTPPTQNSTTTSPVQGTVRQGFSRTASNPGTSNPNPFARVSAQPTVIEPKRSDANTDIDELDNIPAYIRRKMSFVKEGAEESKSARVVLKDDSHAEGKPSDGNSLFD